MGRTSAGVCLLALVVIVLAATSALFGTGLPGSARRTPPPEPPPVGSCGRVVDGDLALMSCDRPHTVEVADGWRADDSVQPPGFTDCARQARSYVGAPPASDVAAFPINRWSLPLRYRSVPLPGPGVAGVAGWSWQACLVVPIGPDPATGYRGSVRGLGAGDARPRVDRLCYPDPGRPLRLVDCAEPHGGEIVAVRPTPATPAIEPTRSAAELSCRRAAASFTGASDPSYAGALVVSVLPAAGQAFPGPLSADIGVYYTADGGPSWLVCALEVAGPRRLTASVGGLGDGPLPFN